MPDGVFEFVPGAAVAIGRTSKNEIAIRHEAVSRIHATVAFDGEHWRYTSFGTNGSQVDGKSVDAVSIREAVQIELGHSGIILEFVPIEASSVEESEEEPGIGSISGCLASVAAGDDEAVEELWARCFATMVRLANQQLSDGTKRVADEEDVAASVFESLFFGIQEGKFPDLSDHKSLWRLIVVMTSRKAADYVNRERRAKRGGGNVRGDSVVIGKSGDEDSAGFDRFVGRRPTPLAVAELEEQLSFLLDELPDDEHRLVALSKLEGNTKKETAQNLGMAERTVDRRLASVRNIWGMFLAASRDDEDPTVLAPD